MGGKWVEFLKEVSPRLARAAFIYNPETAPYPYHLPPFEAAARLLAWSRCCRRFTAPKISRLSSEASARWRAVALR